MQGIAIVEADLGNPQHQDAIVHLVDAYARDADGGGKALPEEVRTALIPGCSVIPRRWCFSLAQRHGRWGLPSALSGSRRFSHARSSTSMISPSSLRIVSGRWTSAAGTDRGQGESPGLAVN